jgi:hypothetical protein
MRDDRAGTRLRWVVALQRPRRRRDLAEHDDPEEPIAIISSVEKTNRYVGMAKMFPDSRRPAQVADHDQHDRHGRYLDADRSRFGTAEMTCSTADDVDTARSSCSPRAVPRPRSGRRAGQVRRATA